jgi:hypothetical protein
MANRNSDGTVNHYNAVRLRVTGSGTLKGQLQTMNEIYTDTFANLTLQATDDSSPVLLANLTSERASLYLYTDQIDDQFAISRIVVFLKQVATSFPQ